MVKYPNISTHPMRLETPKEKEQKNKGITREKMITPWN
jgi:hypothetical protein